MFNHRFTNTTDTSELIYPIMEACMSCEIINATKIFTDKKVLTLNNLHLKIDTN